MKSKAEITAWGWFSKYIRLRDCLATTNTKTRGRCCTCGKIVSFGEAQAGHYKGGRHNAVLFDEIGVNLQCSTCNMTLSGNPVEYKKFMRRKHGDQITDQKIRESWQIVKYSEADLREISNRYRILYNEMK